MSTTTTNNNKYKNNDRNNIKTNNNSQNTPIYLACVRVFLTEISRLCKNEIDNCNTFLVSLLGFDL